MAAEAELQPWADTWMKKARCTEAPALFEPESFEPSSLKIQRARQLCGLCPVRGRCLVRTLTGTYTMPMPVWKTYRYEWRYEEATVSEIGPRAYEALEPGRIRVFTGGGRPTKKRIRDTPSILAGTTPEERADVEMLPLPSQAFILEARVHQAVTQGPYRTLRETEYVALAPEGQAIA